MLVDLDFGTGQIDNSLTRPTPFVFSLCGYELPEILTFLGTAQKHQFLLLNLTQLSIDYLNDDRIEDNTVWKLIIFLTLIRFYQQ